MEFFSVVEMFFFVLITPVSMTHRMFSTPMLSYPAHVLKMYVLSIQT